jgi:hypothetical protein
MIAKLAGVAAVVAVIVGLGAVALKIAQDRAVQAERRERMEDAIDLIRTSDKQLEVVRKASDADLCRALGGRTVEGVCQ